MGGFGTSVMLRGGLDLSAQKRLEAELQALFDASCKLEDWDLARTLHPDIDISRPLAIPTELRVTNVPASLLGLVAQRGQTVLVNRLVRLSESVAQGTLGLPHAAALHVKETEVQDQKSTMKGLQKLLESSFEHALITGDRTAVAAMLPDYETKLQTGHLEPTLEHGLPALVELAASRGDIVLMAALQSAGAAQWASQQRNNRILSLLKGHIQPTGSSSPAQTSILASSGGNLDGQSDQAELVTPPVLHRALAEGNWLVEESARAAIVASSSASLTAPADGERHLAEVWKHAEVRSQDCTGTLAPHDSSSFRAGVELHRLE